MNRQKTYKWLVLCLVLIASADRVFASTDFEQCFAAIRNGSLGNDGGTDNQGTPVSDIRNATAITYEKCLEACGTGGGAFSWSSFSQQFSAWLLPWIALLSQFPFGCRYKWDNLMSVILALGSPCLAAYSLSITVLNNRWVAKRFADISYPNKRHAALILCGLQQTALKVTNEDTLLASLIVLPENDPWWEELVKWLGYADIHTWTIAGGTQVAWVGIAYALTIIDAFSTISTDPNNNGQGLSGVGSIWLWLIPLVIGYMQISPRCDTERVNTALKNANKLSYVAGPNGIEKAADMSDLRALSIQLNRGTLHSDQEASAPIYNYARFLPFVQVVEEFVSAFKAATRNANSRHSVNGVRWQSGDGETIHPDNRTGSAEQIEAYCRAPPAVRRSHWGPDVFSRFFIATVAALALQWSTSGASILIVYYTPTVGLGCRSVAYLLYAGVATFVWMLLVLSSFLSHYASSYPDPTATRPDVSHTVAAYLAIFLRRFAKCLATLNAAWIMAAFLLQFANFFDRCYCNSDVLGLGKRAHNDMVLLPNDISAMKGAWAGGIALATVASLLWWGFIGAFMDVAL